MQVECIPFVQWGDQVWRPPKGGKLLGDNKYIQQIRKKYKHNVKETNDDNSKFHNEEKDYKLMNVNPIDTPIGPNTKLLPSQGEPLQTQRDTKD